MNGGRHKPITAYYEKIYYVHQILCQKINCSTASGFIFFDHEKRPVKSSSFLNFVPCLFAALGRLRSDIGTTIASAPVFTEVNALFLAAK